MGTEESSHIFTVFFFNHYVGRGGRYQFTLFDLQVTVGTLYNSCIRSIRNLGFAIDHFTVVCLVAWPLNESEARVDLVLIETLLLFICKFLLISMRTASLT